MAPLDSDGYTFKKDKANFATNTPLLVQDEFTGFVEPCRGGELRVVAAVWHSTGLHPIPIPVLSGFLLENTT